MRLKGKTCKVKRIFVVAISICALLLVSGIYYFYIMVYRQNIEPKTDAKTTNTEAALYSLKEQLSVLKKFDEMYEAMSEYILEKDCGTVVLPGLKSTRTLKMNESKKISICTSMTPQGLCVAEEYLLVSAYCHTHTHNSVIYALDKYSGEFIKEIVLDDKIHVGGLAYDTEHEMIWVATGGDSHASVSAFSLAELKSYHLEKRKKAISYRYVYELFTLEKDSFLTCYEGCLYVGHFSMKDNSVVQKFLIDEDGGLKIKSGAKLGIDKEIALPEEIKQIPDRIQGIAIYKDKVLLNQSYGWTPSKLLVYNNSDYMHEIEMEYTIDKIRMPQKLEQAYLDGDDLYVLFESAAYAYRAQPLPKVDRICKLSLNKLLNDTAKEKNERDK